MQIQEIMNINPRLASPDMRLQECARIMKDEDLGALPVEENDRLVGMVTDRDIAVRGVAVWDDPTSTTVRDVMSEGVCYVFDDEDAEACASKFAEHQVRRMPVLNRDKRLVGIVAIADLARAGIKNAGFEAYKGVAEPTGAERRM